MAEFGAKATELSAPQGAGASPLAPVREQYIDTNIMPLLADVGNIFIKGLGDSRKADAEAAKVNVVSSYTQEQEAINQASLRGDINPTVAAARSRSLFGKYAAGNAGYIEDLHKAKNALSGGSELGEIEDSAKAAQAVQKARVASAQQRGASMYSWMDPATLEKTLQTNEASIQAEHVMDRQMKMAAEQRAQGAEGRAMSAEERTVLDRERKEVSLKVITELAGGNVDRMGVFIGDIAAKVKSGVVTTQDAQLMLTKEFSQIEGAIQAAAGLNGDMAGAYRSLFDEMKLVAAKAIDPKTAAEVDGDAYKALIMKQKLMAVTDDPALLKVVVASELIGGQAIVALNATTPITKYLAQASSVDATDGKGGHVPTVIGDPKQEGPVLDFLSKSITKLNAKGFKDNDKAEKETISNVNNILKQTGDQLKLGNIKPQNMQNITKFFADPEYGKFVASGKLNKDAAQTAKEAWQVGFVPSVQQSINSRIAALQEKFPGGGGVSKKDVSTLLDVRFDGAGISFSAKAAPAMEPYEMKWQKESVDDLNRVKTGINQMIRIGAHMEGHTDYAKYWEENKYSYLPQVYPARAGVIVNGYKSKGGVGSDPSNWEKVQ
jgi:hypothetical protein